MHNTEKKLT